MKVVRVFNFKALCLIFLFWANPVSSSNDAEQCDQQSKLRNMRGLPTSIVSLLDPQYVPRVELCVQQTTTLGQQKQLDSKYFAESYLDYDFRASRVGQSKTVNVDVAESLDRGELSSLKDLQSPKNRDLLRSLPGFTTISAE